MILTEHHFECPSLKGDCTGSSESTLVEMPHSLFGKHMSLLKLQILMVFNRNFHSRVPAPLKWLAGLFYFLILKAFKLLTDHSKAELLYLSSPLTYCLVCVLQPCVHLLGKGLRPASPVRQVQHLLDPLFWPSMLSTVFFLSRFVFFSLSLPLILLNHATIY